jgi:hypothetical protein
MDTIKPLDIRTGAYFSGAIFYLGIGMILPGLFLTKVYPLAILPFFLISMITLTTHHGLEVDVNAKCYREYVWLLGLKLGQWEIFERMEYIFIKRNKESQTIHSRISSRDLHYEVYNGYLRFSETNKVHVATTRNRESLLKSLKPIAKHLHLEILDYSGGTPIVIPAT